MRAYLENVGSQFLSLRQIVGRYSDCPSRTDEETVSP
jgi:hypothetical protein